jgi:hypothetical protein
MPTCLFFEYSTDLLIIINTLARDEGALPSSLIHHQSRTKFVVIDRRKMASKGPAQHNSSHHTINFVKETMDPSLSDMPFVRITMTETMDSSGLDEIYR